MTRAWIDLPGPHPAQKAILDSPARYRVVACGRRFGKTEVGKQALIRAVVLGRGDGWWLAPTHGMAAAAWRELRAALRPHAARISETERRIELTHGGTLEVHTAHAPDNLRGAGLDFAVLDEAAFMEASVWPEVVRPMLLLRRGRALFLSTPFGQNWFYRLYTHANDPLTPDWAAFHFPSTANPLVDPAEIERIRTETPERTFREEYLAAFTSDAGQVFRGVEAAVVAAPPAGPEAGHRYVMGVDWARDGDFTALTVLDVTSGRLVALDRFNGVGYTLQRSRLRKLAVHWKVDVIWAEANSVGAVNIEELGREGLPVRPFTTTARSKPPLIEGLAVAVERGEIGLLNDPVLLAELAAYTIERLPGGGFRYSAPSGGHDDTVIATALAWYGAAQVAPLIAFG